MRYILIILYLFSFIYTQSILPDVAPLNPNFIKYQEDKKSGLINKINSKGYPNSIIPHPTDHKIDMPKNYVAKPAFTERYDLRAEGCVTPVKNQGQCGSCWIFASLGSIESIWMQLGLGIHDLSENNAANENGFEGDPCEGGNAKKVTPYLLRGDGPLAETDDPYMLGKVQDDPVPQGIVSEARFLSNDADIIKQHITDYGGVFSAFWWFGDFNDYYRQSDNTYFYSSNSTDTTDVGHAIVLIGWDDDMQTAGGTGAWIIKNSWGENFGENGYFYIAYQDSFLNSGTIASWPERQDHNDHSTIYYYDKLGHLLDWGYEGGISYALVKYTMQKNETLMKVGTYTVRGTSQISFDIWDDFDGFNLTNLRGSTSISDINTCDYPGYYSYDIQNPIELMAGEDVYIRVRYQTLGYDHPIPIEGYIEDYSNPQIEAEGFWISQSGNAWFPVSGNPDYPFDPCIKLYTTETAWVATDDEHSFSTNFQLNQNYPNPFNPITTIDYNLTTESDVNITIYDLRGNEVKQLLSDYQPTGTHSINWDGTDNSGETVGGGVYFYQLKSGDFIQTMKMVLLK